MVSKAGLNSQSIERLDAMVRLESTGSLDLVFDNIIDGTGLTVTVPNGTEDAQKCVFTWEFGSSFTLNGAFRTALGDDTQITFEATDKSALVTMVWDTSAMKWSI